MGDALKCPWILNAIYDRFDGETPATEAGRPPKLVQLVSCWGEEKGMVSDKFAYLVALFPNLGSMSLGMSLGRMRGGLLRLDKFQFEAVDLSPDTRIVVLIVSEFAFVGAEGCPPHGDPRYVMTHKPLAGLLRNPPRLSASTATASTSIATNGSWEGTLQPEELCEMEVATQRLLQNRTWDIDQYIEDEDWQIGTQFDATTTGAAASPVKPVAVTTPKDLLALALLTSSPGDDYFARLDQRHVRIDYSRWRLSPR